MSNVAKRLLAKGIYGTFQQKSLENMIRRELVLNFGYDNKLAIADVLAKRVLELVDEFAPDRERVRPLQAVWVAVDRYESPAYGKTLADTQQRPVILDLWTREEIDELAGGRNPTSLLPARVARLCKQALEQDGVLIQTDLALLLGVSVSTIRKAIDAWQQQHDEILPLRGTVHDMGMTFTHKRQIIALHLQGYFTSEIAKITNHDPMNVDRYIQDFERLLEFAKEKAPINKICFYTGLSEGLAREYLDIISENRLVKE